jgi:mono/diheme cytochrome c family protein
MMPPVLRRIRLLPPGASKRARLGSAALVAIALAVPLAGCGTQGIELADDDPDYAGAVVFSDRCSGCHSLDAVGAQGSANRALRNQGPNLNERVESVDDVLYAIRNGGFSGAIMPQNIVVGAEAEAVANFVAENAGTEVDRPPQPGGASETQSEEQQAAAEGE